jgi:DNA polymerase-3 subunit epsilon
MPKLDETDFVCLDIESTGLDTSTDRIIELAAVVFTMDTIVDEFESLINPEMQIPAASQAVHNISQEMVMDSPKIKDILPDFLAFVGNRTLVGHGVKFDIDIVCKEAQRAGIPCTLQQNRSFDTLRLARLYGESPSNSLDTLRKHFNIQPEGAHRAKADVIVNVQVFRYLVQKFRTTEQIEAVLSKPIFMKNMPLGKHKGRSLKEIPIDYLCWAARQEFDNDLLFSLRSEIQRRKKGNSFTDAVNPFRLLEV